MEEQDPFQFILEVSEISRSQESLLPVSAFTGESVNAGDKEPPCSSVFPAEDQAGLLMFSMPETQDAAGRVAAGGSGTQEQEDVFHTPPEKSSAPSSGDQPPLDHCEINRELDARDDETLGFVDFGDSQGTGCVNLGKDSELGFSDVKPSQEVEGKLVAQSPLGIKRDAVAEEVEGFERESSIGELPVKKSKLSEPNLGFDSSRACLGIESHELEESNGNCKVGADVEPEKVDLAEEQVSGDNEISVQKNLGDCHEIEANEKKTFVFYVLKFLAKNSPDDNEDGDGDGDGGGGENASLENAVKICGIDFPRPRWWPDTDLFRK